MIDPVMVEKQYRFVFGGLNNWQRRVSAGYGINGEMAMSKYAGIKWKGKKVDRHRQLRNILAIIHRDGGHYVAEHGLEKATEDAINKVANLIHERQTVDKILLKRAYSLGYDSGRANNNSLSHCWDRDKYFFDE